MELDEIIVKESPGLCRCCLSEGCYKDLGTEYVWMDETEVYADMLLECFDISISQHIEGPNGPSRLICEVCITRLRDACNFKKQVLESEKKFNDMLGRGEFKTKVIVHQEEMKSEDNIDALAQATGEAEVEFLEKDIDNDDGPNNDVSEPTVSEDITVATLPIKGKRGRPQKNAVKPEKKKSKIEDKPKTKVVRDIKPRKMKGCESTSMRRRKNLQLLFNNTTVIPFKWRGKYLCFYCSKTISEYSELRKHTISHGDCSTEDHSLKVLKGGQNMEIKIDISKITCKICSENFHVFRDVLTHLIDEHELEFDREVDMGIEEYRLFDLGCHRCHFGGIYLSFKCFPNLVGHVNNNHAKNFFTCDKCKRRFNKKRSLISHIKYYHTKGGYQCNVCPHSFSSLDILRKHKINRHLTKCNICNLRLPSVDLKQKHMETEHPEDED